MKVNNGLVAEQNISACSPKNNMIPKSIWYLLLFSLIVRLVGFGIYLLTGGNGMVTDSASYINPAITFTQSFSFGESAFRTPGYPFLIAICLGIAGKYYYFGLVILQIMANVLAVYYVYRLAMLLANKHSVGFIAAILVALNPMDIMYNYLILTDSLSQALLLIAVYYFARYIISLQQKKPRATDALCAGVLLAANILVRPSLMYLPLALAFGAVIVAIIFRCYRQILVSILCVCVITQAPVIMWTQRNRAVVGYNGYSTVSDINLYYYNAVVIYAKENGLSYYQAREQMLDNKDEGLHSYLETMPEYEAIRKRGMELICSDFPYYISCCLKNCGWIAFYPGAMTFSGISNGVSDAISMVKSGGSITHVVAQVLTPETLFPIVVLGVDVLILVALAVFSWIGLIKKYKKNWIMATLILGIVAYIYVVSCQPVGIGSYSRFRMACSTFTAVLSAIGIDCLIVLCRKKRVRRKNDERTF